MIILMYIMLFGFSFEIVLLVSLQLFNYCVYLSLLAFIYWYTCIWLHELQWYCGSTETLFSGGGGGGLFVKGKFLDPFFGGGPFFSKHSKYFRHKLKYSFRGVHKLQTSCSGGIQNRGSKFVATSL